MGDLKALLGLVFAEHVSQGKLSAETLGKVKAAIEEPVPVETKTVAVQEEDTDIVTSTDDGEE